TTSPSILPYSVPSVLDQIISTIRACEERYLMLQTAIQQQDKDLLQTLQEISALNSLVRERLSSLSASGSSPPPSNCPTCGETLRPRAPSSSSKARTGSRQTRSGRRKSR